MSHDLIHSVCDRVHMLYSKSATRIGTAMKSGALEQLREEERVLGLRTPNRTRKQASLKNYLNTVVANNNVSALLLRISASMTSEVHPSWGSSLLPPSSAGESKPPLQRRGSEADIMRPLSKPFTMPEVGIGFRYLDVFACFCSSVWMYIDSRGRLPERDSAASSLL
jgi:hypothetical protein